MASRIASRIVSLLTLTLAFLTASLRSPVAAQQSIMGVQTGDLRIQTESTDYQINTGDFTMPHHLSATRPGMTIDGDRARGNGKRRIVQVDGHVVVHQSAESSGSGEPSTLTADRLILELGPRVYTAEGNLHFSQGTRTVTADRGVLHEGTHVLQLSGHVEIHDGDQSIAADAVDYNTQSEDVKAHENVRILVPARQGGGSPLGQPLPTSSPRPRRGK